MTRFFRFRSNRVASSILPFWVVWLTQSVHASESIEKKLAEALARENLVEIRAAVSEAQAFLGDRAGVPEVADEYASVPVGVEVRITTEQAQKGFEPHFQKLQSLIWWEIGIDPTIIRQPLRAPASVLAGSVAACRAELDGAERSLQLAKGAAEFLLWAQEEAGSGVFPFPTARGKSNDRAMQVGARFLQEAEKAGRLHEVVCNGWAIEDFNDGGLQFDNGECGVAMFEYYQLTKDDRALAAGRRAADWALARPLVPNWNYNSFSVYLLAKAYEVTGEQKYLDAAVKKAILGVIPGQLVEGPYAGRWFDPHNARPPYHFIMMRALGQLDWSMPEDDPRRAEVIDALALGLKSRNSEIVERGVMNKDKAVETLVLVNRWFAHDPEFLRETQSDAALDVLARLVSAQAEDGRSPLGPKEWGLFLEWIAGQSRDSGD